tara:strand:+ start:19130 stop:19240 length:111 start_codon:yes stop_codon:yes gene_type:complete
MTREIIDAPGPFYITVHNRLVAGTGGVTRFPTAGLI